MSPFFKKCAAIAIAALAALVVYTVSGYVARASAESSAGYSGPAECMIVIERESGRVFNEKNADRRRPMASTTKIATALTVLNHVADLDRVVEVPAAAAGVEGSSIYLRAGERISVRDLLYGLMLRSGNDCAVALALTTAGSVEKFADLMNETAAGLGLENTHFVNPHGLHDDEHYTTARDLARIAAAAMKNATFREIVAARSHKIEGRDGGEERVLANKNKILSTYEGGDGVKTGFTKKAGRCLVASATRDGMGVIAVVLNCGLMFEDCRALMDEAFSRYGMYDLTEGLSAAAPVTGGRSESVALGCKERACYPLTEEEAGLIEREVSGVTDMRAPVAVGVKNGKFSVTLRERLIFETELYTIEEVAPLSVRDILLDEARKWNGQ